jgi:hypothetical protein
VPVGSVVDGTLEPLADAVERSARTGEPFRLESVTDFEWDRMYAFPPYTPADEIRRGLGIEWADAGDSSIGTSDVVTLLVFMRDRQVVRAFDHGIEGGDLVCVAPPVVEGGLPADEAVLRASRSPAYGGSLEVVSLARPRNDREAARSKDCLEDYS